MSAQTSAPQVPTPHWERRWPHDQPNGWNLDAAKFLALVQANPMMWLALGRAKYLEMRIDTRDGGFNLYDRDKQPLNPDDVIAAIEKVHADYGESIRPQASAGERGWQDISTAPKDGTPMLFCHWTDPEQDVLPITSGFWSRLSEGWFSEMSGQKIDPTHWMPLLAPPATLKPGRGK